MSKFTVCIEGKTYLSGLGLFLFAAISYVGVGVVSLIYYTYLIDLIT